MKKGITAEMLRQAGISEKWISENSKQLTMSDEKKPPKIAGFYLDDDCYASGLEAQFALRLKTDGGCAGRVEKVWHEPFSFYYTNGKRRRKYTPDFVTVEMSSSTGVAAMCAYEVKGCRKARGQDRQLIALDVFSDKFREMFPGGIYLVEKENGQWGFERK